MGEEWREVMEEREKQKSWPRDGWGINGGERERTLELRIMEERERTGEKAVECDNKIWVESGFELAIESKNNSLVVFKFGMGPT